MVRINNNPGGSAEPGYNSFGAFSHESFL